MPPWQPLWPCPISLTETGPKWLPGIHHDKPDGLKRHFGLGRPRHAWIRTQDRTNSATYKIGWFPGDVLRRVVKKSTRREQDVRWVVNILYQLCIVIFLCERAVVYLMRWWWATLKSKFSNKNCWLQIWLISEKILSSNAVCQQLHHFHVLWIIFSL